MKTMYYHESFEYQDEYDFEKLGEKGIKLSSKKIVCPTCHGNGTHFRKDLDESKLVESMEDDGDYDGLDSYYNGAYDQVCVQCNGKNVVDDFNWEQLPEWANKCITSWEQSERESNYIEAQEKAFGA